MNAGSVASILECQGYVQDGAAGIWRQKDAVTIAYSDGNEPEERLLREVANVKDLSVDSPEWARLIVDWPSEYHFSRVRCNLLRPIPIRAGDRVLELGAGCGAITRWLGEVGAEVIAVEGSARRAAILAARCRDLPNVHVVVQNLHAIPLFAADWVLLIGVLEYARLYHSGTDAVTATLRAARSQLMPGGALVLAIENQLGLKYWTGCREDHLGTRFSGISGLYRDDGPVTFGRRELGNCLAAAGFTARRFLLPWPDYKLPTAVVDERAADDPDLDLAAFVARAVARDYGYGSSSPRGFLEPLVWNVLERNGLIADFANSFLVVATESDNALSHRTSDSSTLAWNYSGIRGAPFCVTTTIVRDADVLRVRKRMIHPQVKAVNGRWQHAIEPVVDYIAGESLFLHMLRHAEAQDEAAFWNAGLRWIDLLRENAALHDGTRPDAAGSWFVDGRSVDLIPGNIIITPSDILRSFDQEWRCGDPVPLPWIILRGLLHFPPLAVQSALFRNQGILAVARRLLSLRDLTLEHPDVEAACEIEAEFQSWVQGIPSDRFHWNLPFLASPGARMAPNVFELADAAMASVTSLRKDLHDAYALVAATRKEAERSSIELRSTIERYEDRLMAHRQQEARLMLECQHQRRVLERFERHPVIGLALRSRRRLLRVLRPDRSREAG